MGERERCMANCCSERVRTQKVFLDIDSNFSFLSLAKNCWLKIPHGETSDKSDQE
jgi:hypothetical protein